MIGNNFALFPKQQLAFKEKTDKWAIDNVEAALNLSLASDQKIRESRQQKERMYDLYNGVMDKTHVDQTVNPHGFKNVTFPANLQNYPIARPKVDLLVGEETKRRFDWKIRNSNDDAVSEREKELKNIIIKELAEMLTSGVTDEKEIQEKLKELTKWMTYTYQDMRERMATHTLSYLFKNLGLKSKFREGFRDALICGEEIYRIDIVANDPYVEKCNPLNIFTLRGGDSSRIEDSDIIVEDNYYPMSYVLDYYFDHLTPAQVNALETGQFQDDNNVLNHRAMTPVISVTDFLRDTDSSDLIKVNDGTGGYYGSPFDNEGNIRVSRVVWVSKRKVGKLTFFDENNKEDYKWVDENYKADTSKGETIKWLWVKEWWEGTKIGPNIYVKLQPIPRIGGRMSNPSIVMPPYVGTIFNVNDRKAKSLMGLMSPYQYLFNIYMYQTELAFTTSHGKIAKIDIARKPDDWSTEQWMYYIKVMKLLVEDSFATSQKGVAQGKLAGGFNSSAGAIDLENGAYIQQHLNMLLYIEQQMGRISGVSEQREGQIQTSELVGNTQRAITQSSHITETWFAAHEETKLRVMEVLLETAKFAWKGGKNKKIQHILDDLSSKIIDIDTDLLAESEYGLIAGNNADDNELFSVLKQLSHAAMQNGQAGLSTIIDVYTSESIAEIRNKLERKEQEQQEQQAQQAQEANASKERMVMLQEKARLLAQKFAEDTREDIQKHELTKIEKEWAEKTKSEITIAEIEAGLEKLKMIKELREADKTRQHEKEENEKDRENDKQIVKLKPKPTKK